MGRMVTQWCNAVPRIVRRKGPLNRCRIAACGTQPAPCVPPVSILKRVDSTMLCGLCVSAERLRRSVDPPPESAADDGEGRCALCGGSLASLGLRARVVAKLKQLRRFGLTAGAKPLFELTRPET